MKRSENKVFVLRTDLIIQLALTTVARVLALKHKEAHHSERTLLYNRRHDPGLILDTITTLST